MQSSKNRSKLYESLLTKSSSSFPQIKWRKVHMRWSFFLHLHSQQDIERERERKIVIVKGQKEIKSIFVQYGRIG